MHYPTSGEEHRVLRVLWRIKNDPETLLSSPATPFPRRTTPLHNMAAGAVLHLPSRGSSSAPPAAAPAPAGPESRARLKQQRCGDLHPLPRLDVPCLAWPRQLWDGEERPGRAGGPASDPWFSHVREDIKAGCFKFQNMLSFSGLLILKHAGTCLGCHAGRAARSSSGRARSGACYCHDAFPDFPRASKALFRKSKY